MDKTGYLESIGTGVVSSSVYGILRAACASWVKESAARWISPANTIMRGDLLLTHETKRRLLLVYDAQSGRLPVYGLATFDPPCSALYQGLFYRPPIFIVGQQIYIDLECPLRKLNGISYVKLGRVPLRYLDQAKILRREIVAERNQSPVVLA